MVGPEIGGLACRRGTRPRAEPQGGTPIAPGLARHVAAPALVLAVCSMHATALARRHAVALAPRWPSVVPSCAARGDADVRDAGHVLTVWR